MEATTVKTQHQATKNRELTNTIDPLLMGIILGMKFVFAQEWVGYPVLLVLLMGA